LEEVPVQGSIYPTISGLEPFLLRVNWLSHLISRDTSLHILYGKLGTITTTSLPSTTSPDLNTISISIILAMEAIVEEGRP